MAFRSSCVYRSCCGRPSRSEEHTSELQSRELISYAVFCLKKQNRCRGVNDIFGGEDQALDGAREHRIGRFFLCYIFFFHLAHPPSSYTSSHTLSLHDALPI